MLIDLLRARRSIRTFADRPVEQAKLDLLVEAVLRSPTSKGRMPWEFVVVTDAAAIARLAQAKPHGSAFLEGAPLVFVVCADPDRSDVWIEDASIAALVLHLQALDLGLGSCWVQIRLRASAEGGTAGEHVAAVVGLPPGMVVQAMVGIGYPSEAKLGHSAAELPYERVSYERFGERRRPARDG